MGNCESEQPITYIDNQHIALSSANNKKIFDYKEELEEGNQHQKVDVQMDLNGEIEDELQRIEPDFKVINLPPFNFGEKKHLNAESRPAFRLIDGSTYVGDWIGDQMTGNGVLEGKNGRYEGQFENGKKCGRGRFTFPNGEVYEGEWKDDYEEGIGTYYYVQGTVYHGQWVQNQKHGQGREVFPNGSSFQGTFENGIKQGQGIFQWRDGTKYEGRFVNNQISGKGIMEYPNGRKYEGEFLNGKMHGHGKFTWPDGRIYEGQYENDKKHGQGVLMGQNYRYEGEWVEGKMEGKGTLEKDGEMKVGLWRNNKFVGEENIY